MWCSLINVWCIGQFDLLFCAAVFVDLRWRLSQFVLCFALLRSIATYESNTSKFLSRPHPAHTCVSGCVSMCVCMWECVCVSVCVSVDLHGRSSWNLGRESVGNHNHALAMSATISGCDRTVYVTSCWHRGIWRGWMSCTEENKISVAKQLREMSFEMCCVVLRCVALFNYTTSPHKTALLLSCGQSVKLGKNK